MMCLSPISLIQKDKKTGIYKRVSVPCSKCAACLQRKRNDWAFRNEQEFKHSYTAYFVTMTYDDDHLLYKKVLPGKYYRNEMDLLGTLVKIPADLTQEVEIPVFDDKREIQLFLKRLRKMCEPCRDLRYFLVSEYGSETLRPHFHFLLYNFPGDADTLVATLEKLWDKGFIYVGDVTKASISYVCKYLLGVSYLPSYFPPCYMLCSKGIGKQYLTDAMVYYHRRRIQAYAIQEDGSRRNLPRYLRTKIFDNTEFEDYLREKIQQYVDNQTKKNDQK